MISIIVPIMLTVLAIGLLISPIDLIPDVIPILGWTDDMLYMMIAIGGWAYYFLGNSIFDLFGFVQKSPQIAIGIAAFVIIFMLIRRK